MCKSTARHWQLTTTNTIAQQNASRQGPPASELETLGKRQLALAEERYHTAVAAANNQYRIHDEVRTLDRLCSVTFKEYTGRSLPSLEAVDDSRNNPRKYIPSSLSNEKPAEYSIG